MLVFFVKNYNYEIGYANEVLEWDIFHIKPINHETGEQYTADDSPITGYEHVPESEHAFMTATWLAKETNTTVEFLTEQILYRDYLRRLGRVKALHWQPFDRKGFEASRERRRRGH